MNIQAHIGICVCIHVQITLYVHRTGATRKYGIERHRKKNTLCVSEG